MKTLPSFFVLFSFLLSMTCCHPAKAEASPTRGDQQTEKLPPGSELESPFMLAMDERNVRCEATGRFNLGNDHDHLSMEVQCSDGEAKLLDAPRLTEKPNIFHIPFKLAVVSIMGEDSGRIKLHLHYYNSQADDVQKIVRLHPDSEGEFTYSFEELVDVKIAPIPLGRKL